MIPMLLACAALVATPPTVDEVALQYGSPGYSLISAPAPLIGSTLFEVNSGDIYFDGETPTAGLYLVIGYGLLDFGNHVVDLEDGQIVQLGEGTGDTITECSVHCGPGFYACCRSVGGVATCDCWLPEQIGQFSCTAGGVGATACSISVTPTGGGG